MKTPTATEYDALPASLRLLLESLESASAFWGWADAEGSPSDGTEARNALFLARQALAAWLLETP
jgi:hypothetical protein